MTGPFRTATRTAEHGEVYREVQVSKQATIQFYRGPAASLPALEDGEPGWTTDTHQLYIGQDGTNHTVGGGAALADGDYGDITVSSSGTVLTIDAGAVGTSKLGDDITTAGKALLDDADASAQRTTLGLGSAAVESAAAFDAAGTAASAISTHEGASDPHPQYLTSTEGDAAYQPADDNLDDIAGLSDPGANRLLGWDDATNAIVWWSPGGLPITMLPGLTLGFVNNTYGDIAVTDDGGTWTIAAGTVAYAKMQDVSAAERLLGRGAGSGSGDVQEISLGTGLSMSGTTLSGLSAASAAEQETGTEAAKYVAPATQQSHHSAAKGWVNFNGTGTVAIRDSYNVDSITDNGTGDYTITWTTDFVDTNYCWVGICDPNTGTDQQLPRTINQKAIAVGSLRTWSGDTVSSGEDMEVMCIVAFGEQ